MPKTYVEIIEVANKEGLIPDELVDTYKNMARFRNRVIHLYNDDCIVNAKDYNAGGARYNTNYIQGVGIGSITDSLAALKKHLFEDNSYSWEEMLFALNNNFSNREAMRHYIINKTPHYKNDDDYADSIMQAVKALKALFTWSVLTSEWTDTTSSLM